MRKYDQFATIIEAYQTGIIDDNDLDELLSLLQDQYQTQHPQVLDMLESDSEIMKQHRSIYDNVREAAHAFETAIDLVYQAVREDSQDLFDTALEVFQNGNRAINEAVLDFEEFVERSELIGEL